jgi:hypothetical protein
MWYHLETLRLKRGKNLQTPSVGADEKEKSPCACVRIWCTFREQILGPVVPLE